MKKLRTAAWMSPVRWLSRWCRRFLRVVPSRWICTRLCSSQKLNRRRIWIGPGRSNLCFLGFLKNSPSLRGRLGTNLNISIHRRARFRERDRQRHATLKRSHLNAVLTSSQNTGERKHSQKMPHTYLLIKTRAMRLTNWRSQKCLRQPQCHPGLQLTLIRARLCLIRGPVKRWHMDRIYSI